MTSVARAFIRLGALRHNYALLRTAAGGAALMAVVKGNAYGHGLVPVAEALSEADSFAVARYPEALALREAGIEQPIVMLEGVTSAEELRGCLERGVHVVVHCERQVALLEASPAAACLAWLKIDTGMRRLGFEPAEAEAVLARLGRCRAVGEVGLMTHLACADDRDADTTRRQLDSFRRLLRGFDGPVSIANSAGLLGWPDAVTAGRDPGHCVARAGLALYGISPFPGTCAAELGLRPAMAFETTLISVKRIRAGEAVGYGATWRAGADTVLGIVAAGYGDGYSRFLPAGTPLRVNGREVTLAGLVSMDMAAVDLGPEARERVGDPVTLWGPDLPVERVAERAGASPYQLVCGVMHREPAAYLP